MSKLVPAIPLDLDNQTVGLVFNFNSVALLKQWADVNVFAAGNPLGDLRLNPDGTTWLDDKGQPKLTIDPTRLRAMLASCMYHQNRKITPDDAGELITLANMTEVTTACMRAFAAYFGKTLEQLQSEAARPTNGAAETPPASINSGPLDVSTSA